MTMLNETPVTKSPEETRQRILLATRQILGRKGRRGATTREIAEMAGVNEATLFRHFGSKDSLIEACAERFCPTVELQELLSGLSGDLVADLKRMAVMLATRMEEIRDLIIMSLADEESDTPIGGLPWRGPVALKQIITDYMTQRVQSGELEGDPMLLARFFMGMIFAQVIGRKKMPLLQYSSDEILDFQINMFLNGVRKK
jgi:TetR/AcrR family transcriptional regulator, mexJK operon transcriptional repressor